MREQHRHVSGHGNDNLVWPFCVGDLLTVERSQNPQDNSQYSSTSTYWLEGLITAMADFRRYGNFLKVNCSLR